MWRPVFDEGGAPSESSTVQLASHAPPRVIVVGMHLDPRGRNPDDLLRSAWQGFGKSAAAARRAGADISIVQAAWADAERELDGVPCSFVSPNRVWARVAAGSPDVIHFEGLALPSELRHLAAAFPGVPILAQDHGTPRPTGWRRWWLRRGLRRLSGAAFTAREQAEPFLASGVLDPALPVFEIVEVSNGFTPGDQRAARSATGMDGSPCLFWAGHLDANKDPLTVLDAVAGLGSRLPGLRLHMTYRSAPLLSSVRARLERDPDLAERVRLLGEVPHEAMESHLRAADFFLQASHVESCGAAVLEALACGTPPIVTNIPSFRRFTDRGRVGALVPVGDEHGFRAAIEQWGGRDRPALRRAARDYFTRELSFEAMGRQLCAAYDALAQWKAA